VRIDPGSRFVEVQNWERESDVCGAVRFLFPLRSCIVGLRVAAAGSQRTAASIAADGHARKNRGSGEAFDRCAGHGACSSFGRCGEAESA
jgi:hypothetical protein